MFCCLRHHRHGDVAADGDGGRRVVRLVVGVFRQYVLAATAVTREARCAAGVAAGKSLWEKLRERAGEIESVIEFRHSIDYLVGYVVQLALVVLVDKQQLEMMDGLDVLGHRVGRLEQHGALLHHAAIWNELFCKNRTKKSMSKCPK